MSSRPRRPVLLSSVMLLLAACGGGSGSAPADGSRVTHAELIGWLDLATNRVALQWIDSVPEATRYDIEQQDSSGAWVVVDSSWPTHQQDNGLFGQSPAWQGIIKAPATLRVEAVTPSSRVLLGTTSSSSSGVVETTLTFAPPASLPSIELDQSEPLESSTQVTLGNAAGLWGEITVDTLPSPLAVVTKPALTLTPGYLTSGPHVVYAMFAVTQPSAAALLISRTVQTHNSALAIASADFAQNADVLDDYLLVSSDAGVASLVASVDDGTAIQTVVAPNACVPQPCGAGQAFNGYHLSVNTRSLAAGSHIFDAVATDSAGNTSLYTALFSLPAPAMGVLASPSAGAVISGTFHVAGTFSAGSPGPLEVTVTLNGAPVYTTTVANTGVTTPFSADVSLSGVPAGYHNLHAYVRVGNTVYTEIANIIVQVAAAP